MIQEHTYKYIDLENLNEMADGENDFILQVVDIYINSIPDNINKLASGASEGNFETVIFYSHKIRGSLNFIGSAQLISILNEIDKYAYKNIADTLPPLIEQLKSVAVDILLELNDLRQKVAKDI